MFGSSKTNTTSPKLANIQVQQSAKNLTITQGWGTFRCACVMLWYGAFTAIEHTEEQGGKGAPSVEMTSYTYTASIVLGICKGEGVAGGINTIRTIWRDKQTFISNASRTAVAQAGLTLATGALGQATWGYLTTNFPAEALGYSGIAIVYAANYDLGAAGTVPNHAFEVVTNVRETVSAALVDDANPADIVEDFLTNTVNGLPFWRSGLLGDLSDYALYCKANDLLVSPYLDSQVQAAQFLGDLIELTNSDPVWSASGVLKIKPRGDEAVTGNGVTWTPDLTPIYALTIDDFLPLGADVDPVQLEPKPTADCYNSVGVSFLDRSTAYAEDVMPAVDQASVDTYGLRKEDPKTFAGNPITRESVAATVAQLRLQRSCYVTRRYRFKTDGRYALLEPADLITITIATASLALSAVLVKIVEANESDNGDEIDFLVEEIPGGTATAATYARQAPAGYLANEAVEPGSVEANLLTWSAAIDDPDWTKSAVTVTADATTSPAGSTSAESVVPTAANTTHSFYQDVAIVEDQPGVLACYFKPDGYKNVLVRIGNSGETIGVQVSADTDAGALLAAPSAYGGATVSDGGMVDAGDGWWRVWVSGIIPGVTSVRCRVYYLSDAGATSWAGNGSDGMFTWGAQYRPGTALPAYVETFGSPAVPVIFNPPAAITTSRTAQEVWAAVAGIDDAWGGCHVWTSVDDVNYQRIGTVFGRTRYGTLVTSLPIGPDPDPDSEIAVDLGVSVGTVENASQDDVDAGVTQFLMGSEVLAWRDATLDTAHAYTLGYLRRGLFGTEIEAHVPGDSWVRIDDGVFRFPYNTMLAGVPVYVKFQSFNIYQRTLQDLATLPAYVITPDAVPAPAPAASEWDASGTSFTEADHSIPAIVIEGAFGNADATHAQFFYRVNGASVWTPWELVPRGTTRIEIAGVLTQGTDYDVGVAYQVGGILGDTRFIETVTAGIAAVGGASSIPDGTVLATIDTAGASSYTIPDGAPGFIDLERWGAGGGGGGVTNSGSGKEPVFSDNYGGGGGGYKLDHIAVSPGDVISFNVGAGGSPGSGGAPGTNGGNTTVSAPGGIATCNGGTAGSGVAAGTGGTASGGTTGRDGGLGNYWDGGGAGNGGGDQTTPGGNGTAPGGGGAGGFGGVGANGRVKITARTS